MLIRQALRADRKMRLAVFGAGGKVDVIYRLARQYEPPVIVTAVTPTRLGQSKLADVQFIVDKEKRGWSEFDPGNRVTLITGPASQENTFSGLGVEELEQLLDLDGVSNIPLLVEAENSYFQPLKAPGFCEHLIPNWVTTVLAVVGFSAVGKPYDGESALGHEWFSVLSGLKYGELITIKLLNEVLTNYLSGLNEIPENVIQAVLIDQVKETEQIVEAHKLADLLLNFYDLVMVGSLSEKDPEKQIMASYENIAGIILAAGEAKRYGRSKILEPWRGVPLIRHVILSALQAGLSPVIVVLGSVVDPVVPVISDLPVQIVVNEKWQTGQSSSMKIGVQSLTNRSGGAVFLLADQPQIPPELIMGLVQTHRKTMAPIIIPCVHEKRGNPVLFDKLTFNDLSTVQGDTGGRAIFTKYPVTIFPWEDERILLDVDTPEDYERLLKF